MENILTQKADAVAHPNGTHTASTSHTNGSASNRALIEEAARLADAGLSILPIARGDKKPAEASWKHRQEQAAASAQVRDFLKNCTAYGIVGGKVSGGGAGLCLSFLDIETDGAKKAWLEARWLMGCPGSERAAADGTSRFAPSCSSEI